MPPLNPGPMRRATPIRLSTFAVAMLALASGGFIGSGIGIAYGRMVGEASVRRDAREAVEHCHYMVGLGLRDWQEAVGTPITKQITCDPLENIAEGRDPLQLVAR